MNELFQCGINGQVMMRGNPAFTAFMVNPESFNDLKVIAYLGIGTFGIGLLFGWALKRFGSPRQ